VEAIRPYLDRPGTVRPCAAFLAVAGRVGGDGTRLTNAGWRFDPGEIGIALGLDAVRLVNDYVPLAAALTILEQETPAELVRIGPPGPPRARGHRAGQRLRRGGPDPGR
jgi:glucokinase